MSSITIRKRPAVGRRWNGEPAWIFEAGKRPRVFQTDCYGVNPRYHVDRESAVAEAIAWLDSERTRLDEFEATL